MKIFICAMLFGFLTLFNISNGSEKDVRRSKVSSVFLTPTFRVGRRSEKTWENALDNQKVFRKFLTYVPMSRRDQKIFLNIDDDSDLTEKRSDSNTGMWFGPRLGRIQKREAPWTYILVDDNSVRKDLDSPNVDTTNFEDINENQMYPENNI